MVEDPKHTPVNITPEPLTERAHDAPVGSADWPPISGPSDRSCTAFKSLREVRRREALTIPGGTAIDSPRTANRGKRSSRGFPRLGVRGVLRFGV